MNASQSDAVAQTELSVRKSADVAAPPETVWAAIGDFSGIADWHPAVETAVLEERDGRKIRVLTLKGGATLVEALVEWDDAAMSYTYAILEGPLPVEHYRSTLSVTAEGDGSRLDWSGTFHAKDASQDEATGVVSGIYESGLAGLVEAAQRP